MKELKILKRCCCGIKRCMLSIAGRVAGVEKPGSMLPAPVRLILPVAVYVKEPGKSNR